MSTFESKFYTRDVTSITPDDITRIGIMVSSYKVHHVILSATEDDEDGVFRMVIRDFGGRCTCCIDGYFPIFDMFGEYKSLDVLSIKGDELLNYGKPKRVTCSPTIPEKYQRYLHENYNMKNILYYPGIIVKPNCMIMYDFGVVKPITGLSSVVDNCNYFIKNFPRNVCELELLVSADVFNPENKEILDEVMEHIGTFPNLRLLWIQNGRDAKIKYDFKPIMNIGCDVIKTRGINTKYVFKNPYTSKIVTDCNPNDAIEHMQKNTTLKKLTLCDRDWSIVILPEELKYFIDRNNQSMKSARVVKPQE